MILLASSISLLKVNPGLAVWTFVTFSIVLFVLWKFAWKPILYSLDKRNQKVVDDLEESKNLRETAEKLLQKYEENLNSAKKSAIEIIEEAQRDAEKVSKRIVEDAKIESKNIKERIEKEIELSKQKALENVENTILNISVNLLSKILKTEVDIKQHSHLIKEQIRSFSNLR